MNNLLLDFKNQKSIIQLFRYGLVGVGSNLIGYLIYLLITSLGISPKVAMSILYVVGASVSFIGNRKLTFAHKGGLSSTIIKYFFAHSIGYLLNLMILIVMVDTLGYAHQWVQAVAILVVACFLFLAFKFFVFRVPHLSSGGADETLPRL